jgi:hypothetical protein
MGDSVDAGIYEQSVCGEPETALRLLCAFLNDAGRGLK